MAGIGNVVSSGWLWIVGECFYTDRTVTEGSLYHRFNEHAMCTDQLSGIGFDALT